MDQCSYMAKGSAKFYILIFIVLSFPALSFSQESTGQTAMVGNPRLMVLYVPHTTNTFPKKETLAEVKQAINGIFVRNGFVVIDPGIIDTVCKEIERAGLIDTDVDAMADLALKNRADLLLLYDVIIANKRGGKSKCIGGFNVKLTLRAVAPATADIIAEKKGSLYVKIPKDITTNFKDQAVGQATRKVAQAVSRAIIKDAKIFISSASRFDVWLLNFSEEDIYVVIDIIEQMDKFKSFDVRNQVPETFQMDVLYKGKKFNLQRQLHKKLKQQEIVISVQQSKGNRLILIKE